MTKQQRHPLPPPPPPPPSLMDLDKSPILLPPSPPTLAIIPAGQKIYSLLRVLTRFIDPRTRLLALEQQERSLRPLKKLWSGRQSRNPSRSSRVCTSFDDAAAASPPPSFIKRKRKRRAHTLQHTLGSSGRDLLFSSSSAALAMLKQQPGNQAAVLSSSSVISRTVPLFCPAGVLSLSLVFSFFFPAALCS